MTIDERKLRILKAIIDDFISTAHPVGSRTLAKKYELGVSSATIRNEMADLEELGYLTQPHTSAGRIPSELGYRLYVDNLMKQSLLRSEQKELIRSLLSRRVIEVEDVLRQTAKIMAELTGLVSFVTLPQFSKSKLENVKLVKIDGQKVLIILVSDSGIYKVRPLPLKGTDQLILDQISKYLVNVFSGETFSGIKMVKLNQLKARHPEYASIIDYLIPLLKSLLSEMDDLDITYDGTNNIFNSPEFQDVVKARALLENLEGESELSRIIQGIEEEEISIRIGHEIGHEDFEGCSIITAKYRFNDEVCGTLGILGPTRIRYGSAVSVVEYIRETLTDIFAGIYL
jgi:heat-inducible transcriptional repressor